jgi:hypothetical protein
MSDGINALKEKMKKKMTLDDLLDPQKDMKLEQISAKHTAVQQNNNSTIHQNNNPFIQQTNKPVILTEQVGLEQAEHIVEQQKNKSTTQQTNKSESHQTNNPTKQQSIKPTILIEQENIQQAERLAFQESNQPVNQQASKPASQQPNKSEIDNKQVDTQQAEHIVEQQNNKPETQYAPRFSNVTVEKEKIIYGKKMTFYLSQELYDAFHEVYAKRMLQGRKTEKSMLLCEAIELLYRNELNYEG